MRGSLVGLIEGHGLPNFDIFFTDRLLSTRIAAIRQYVEESDHKNKRRNNAPLIVRIAEHLLICFFALSGGVWFLLSGSQLICLLIDQSAYRNYKQISNINAIHK